MSSDATTMPATNYALSPSELDFFHDNGYLGPFAAVSPDEMAGIRQHIDTQVLTRPGSSPRVVQSRHMDSKVVYELATHPAILVRMASLFGPHLILWATNFFRKDPGGVEIPWH